MAQRSDFNEVAEVMEAYFEGLYQADSKLLLAVFHPDARYVNAVDGDYMNYDMPTYFEIVDGRDAPSATEQARADKILSIEFGGTQTAFVHASMRMMGREYIDFLTFIREGDRWQIISKIFSYTPLSKET